MVIKACNRLQWSEKRFQWSKDYVRPIKSWLKPVPHFPRFWLVDWLLHNFFAFLSFPGKFASMMSPFSAKVHPRESELESQPKIRHFYFLQKIVYCQKKRKKVVYLVKTSWPSTTRPNSFPSHRIQTFTRKYLWVGQGIVGVFGCFSFVDTVFYGVELRIDSRAPNGGVGVVVIWQWL